VAWGIHPGGGCDGAGDRGGGRLNAQRDLWYLEDLGGSTLIYQRSRLLPATTHRARSA
jgi:hypothetical protein